jgi:dUTP pyrophosphatase
MGQGGVVMNNNYFKEGSIPHDPLPPQREPTIYSDPTPAGTEITVTTIKEEGKMEDKLNVELLNPRAVTPTKREEDGGYDLYACFEDDFMKIKAGEIKLIPTKIAMAFPQGYTSLFRERGSTGTIGMAVRAGVVDSGYRGEVFVAIQNTRDKALYITKEVKDEVEETKFKTNYPYNKAIAQMLLVKTPHLEVKQVEDINQFDSERGEGKLGDSGK